MQKDEEQLDELLRSSLANGLDGQLGRAGQAFAAQASPRRVFPGAIRIIVAAGAIAAVVAWAMWPAAAPEAAPIAPVIASNPEPDITLDPHTESEMTVQRWTVWNTTDEGSMVLGNVPMQQLRRHVLEQTSWTDPDGELTVIHTVPRKDLVLVEKAIY